MLRVRAFAIRQDTCARLPGHRQPIGTFADIASALPSNGRAPWTAVPDEA